MSLALETSAENDHHSWDNFIIKCFSSYWYTVNMIFKKGGYYRLSIVRHVFLKDLVNWLQYVVLMDALHCSLSPFA